MTYDAKEKSAYGGEPVECYKFTSGGTTWRYTSGDVISSITIGGVLETFRPELITRNGIEYDDSEQGTVEVKVPRWSEIGALYIPYTPTEPVGLTIYRAHVGDADVVVAFSGKVVSASFEGSEVTLTCSPTRSILKRPVPRVSFQSGCNWALYSPRCGVSKDDFKVDAILSAISGNDITSTTFGAQADGYYKNGWVELASGEKRFVVDHVGNVLTLMSPFFGIAVPVTVTAYAGCDRTEAVCAAKFSNLANHFGFSRVPQRNVHEKGLG